MWIDDRPTTWKQRIVARGQLRPDRCDREVTTPISDHASRFLSAVPLGDMVLVSDHGKGVCTRSLMQALGDRARAAGVPILVDPARGRSWSDYGQVTLIKANWAEATEAAGDPDVRPLTLARQLADERRCHVVVTIGRHGMVCAERTGCIYYRPADQVDPRDVCGAGDTVLASLGVGLAIQQPLRQACEFASTAGASQVTHTGVAAIRAPWRDRVATGSWPAII